MVPASDWIRVRARDGRWTRASLLEVEQHRGRLQQGRPGAARPVAARCRAGRSSRCSASTGPASPRRSRRSRTCSLENGELTGGAHPLRRRATSRHCPRTRLVRGGLFHVMEGRHVFEDLTVEENLAAATYALAGRRAPADDFRPRLRVLPAPARAAHAGLPATCPAASSRCWPSAAR